MPYYNTEIHQHGLLKTDIGDSTTFTLNMIPAEYGVTNQHHVSWAGPA